MADRCPGGAPVGEVLAVVGGQAVAALADSGGGPIHGTGALLCSRVRVLDPGPAASGELWERDDADSRWAVLADAAALHLDAEMAIGDPPGADLSRVPRE